MLVVDFRFSFFPSLHLFRFLFFVASLASKAIAPGALGVLGAQTSVLGLHTRTPKTDLAPENFPTMPFENDKSSSKQDAFGV